jgi:ribosomal protein S26
MLFLIHRFHLYLTYKYPKKSNPLGFVDCVDILAVRLTQSLTTNSLRDCQLSSASDLSTASTSSQFALPKALQPIRFGIASLVQPRICRLRRHPRSSPYPKPYNQTLRVQLAFLLFVCLRK